MSLTDEEAAHAAISRFADNLTIDQQTANAAVQNILGNSDTPFVDVHELFNLFDTLYFRNLLSQRRVEVSWSTRMTLCAGLCELLKDEQGRYRRIRVKLSEPLLKYRPREDTINTLLHEAIHAYFFITSSWRHSRGDDGTGHGVGFQSLADAVNSHGGYAVTVFHTFHDEVDSYRTHVWQCDGHCQSVPPQFGLVKRSMNRAPGKADGPWWDEHEQACGGSFTKIAAPEPTKEQLRALSAKTRAGMQKNKITNWISTNTAESSKRDPTTAAINDVVITTTGQGCASPSNPQKKRALSAISDQDVNGQGSIYSLLKKSALTCPICDAPVTEQNINDHLDNEHA